MRYFALTYWFTWAFLVAAAAFTGVASLKDAFFGGLFAALLSAALARVYERAGLRYAPLVGATAGVCWVMAMYYRIQYFGYPEDFARAQWTLGTDISVHVAGFAGAALLIALRTQYGFGRALLSGLGLAAAMTFVPYGFIAWVDQRVAGPIEVVLLVSAEVSADEGPPRRIGAVQAKLTPTEIAFLKERLLVTDGPGGVEVIDEQGRRFWPLWRRRLVYPGNPGGPVRTLLMVLPPGLMQAETWSVPVHPDPTGLALAVLDAQQQVRAFPMQRSQSIDLQVQLKLRSSEGPATYQNLEVITNRRAPLGEMYMPVTTLGLTAAFVALPAAGEGPAVKVDPKIQKMRRPAFGAPEPAAK